MLVVVGINQWYKLQDSPTSDASWPLDHRLFLASAADTVRRLRCHACVALWCGGNEQRPAPDLDGALRRMLPTRPIGDISSQQGGELARPSQQCLFFP